VLWAVEGYYFVHARPARSRTPRRICRVHWRSACSPSWRSTSSSTWPISMPYRWSTARD
jgi:hypothetical protein